MGEDVSGSNKNYRITAIGYALLATLLWSGNFIAAKALHQSISPVSLAFYRWTVATLIILPFAYRTIMNEWKAILPHAKYICYTALAGVTLFNTLLYVAGKYTTATNLALIGTTAAPVFVLIISGVFLKQRISLNQVLGAIFCITGIILLLSGGNLGRLGNFQLSLHDGWIFLAALSFAIYTILVRKKPKELSSVSFLFSIFLMGTIFLLPVFVLNSVNGDHIQWNKSIIYTILYLGIGASVIAFFAWNISIKRLGAATTALFGNLIPIFSTIEASLILDEPFNRITILSLLIILVGLFVANINVFRAVAKKEA